MDGGICRFQAAHFEWLLKVGEGLGLSFDDLGKRRHGRPATLYFCDELQRALRQRRSRRSPRAPASPSRTGRRPASGRSWKTACCRSRTAGIRSCGWPSSPGTTASRPSTPATRWKSWRKSTSTPDFDREKFFQGGREILEAVAAFWDGLERIASTVSTRDVCSELTAAVSGSERQLQWRSWRNRSAHARRTFPPGEQTSWQPISFRCGGSITFASSSATPGSRRTSTATPSASTWSPTPAWKPRRSTRPATSCGRATSPSCSPRRWAPSHPECQRLIQHGDGVQDIALEVDDVRDRLPHGRRAAAPSA